MLKGMKCCQVDALITIDGRGQLVLPKEVREKADGIIDDIITRLLG